MYSNEAWRSAWSPANPFALWFRRNESGRKYRHECWNAHIIYHGAESRGIYIGLSANDDDQNFTESLALGIFEERRYGIFEDIRKSQPNLSLWVLWKVLYVTSRVIQEMSKDNKWMLAWSDSGIHPARRWYNTSRSERRRKNCCELSILSALGWYKCEFMKQCRKALRIWTVKAQVVDKGHKSSRKLAKDVKGDWVT